jgi:hypothetical protein
MHDSLLAGLVRGRAESQTADGSGSGWARSRARCGFKRTWVRYGAGELRLVEVGSWLLFGVKLGR